MKRRKAPKEAASTATKASPESRQSDEDQARLALEQERTRAKSKLKFLLLSFVGIALSIHLSLSSESPTSTSHHSTFDEFYAAHVQPVLDRGKSAFNGTRIESEEKSRVGYRLRHAPASLDGDGATVDAVSETKGARAKYPIVLIPGFITTGLELWEGHECFRQHFRQRLWGSVSMARTFFSDRECWRKHLALDPRTGLDPEGIRLRAAQGFEAADNFVATYW